LPTTTTQNRNKNPNSVSDDGRGSLRNNHAMQCNTTEDDLSDPAPSRAPPKTSRSGISSMGWNCSPSRGWMKLSVVGWSWFIPMVDAMNHDNSNNQVHMTLKGKIHSHYWSQIFKHKLNETSSLNRSTWIPLNK
jgi:hypothetical protein